MVILEQIRKSPAGIECYYNPEQSGMIGHIDMKNDGTATITYSEYAYARQTYVAVALNKLRELLKSSGDIPRSVEVMWY